MVAIGFSLQPDREFLGLCDEIITEHIDYAEIAPETTWQVDRDGRLFENGFHAHFAALVERSGLFAVAHGVGLSLSTAHDDGARQALWLNRMRTDQAVFGYRWYTEHLGASSLAGLCMMLPMPVPMTPLSAALTGQRLDAMQTVVADVGIENSVFYFNWDHPDEEAPFVNQIVAPHGRHLLLDLHNLYTASVNTGIDSHTYLDALDLDQVIEIHLSGGTFSDSSWLPGGDVMRLDSHDSAVPEPIWQLLVSVLPRCRNLCGITVERMEGTVTAADVSVIKAEIERARALAEQYARSSTQIPYPGANTSRPEPASIAAARIKALTIDTSNPTLYRGQLRFEAAIAQALSMPDPVAAVRFVADDETLPDQLRRAAAQAPAHGIRITALLVARLRFERLLQGSPAAAQWFEREPAGFAEHFRRYHAEVPPSAFFPPDEAELFLGWQPGY